MQDPGNIFLDHVLKGKSLNEGQLRKLLQFAHPYVQTLDYEWPNVSEMKS